VIVDPGVVVDLAPSATLTLLGDLIGIGTPAQPVTLRGGARIDVFGSLDLDQAIVDTRIDPFGGCSMTCRNVSFLSGAFVFSGGATSGPAFIDIDQCSVDGPWFRVGACVLRLTNTSFTNAFCELWDCNLFLDNVTFDGAPWTGLNLQFFLQPVWLNNVSVTNSGDAALDLAAVNVRLGPNVVLAGNRYPAQIGGSGFLPGSTLPAAGNTNNHILVESASAGLVAGNTWCDVGVPYAIPDFYSAGPLDILEGTRILLGPLAEFWGVNGRVAARGTPTNPVVFERLDPLQQWQGLQKFHRFENCVIDGGQVGARFNSITFQGFIDNCLIRNCDFGTQNDVIVRKTRFENNLIGSWGDNWPHALDGTTGGNSFSGNGLAVDDFNGSLIDAADNWWNDPAGPIAFDNPKGQGEPVSPGVRTLPFLTTPPDFTDNPPVVHLNRHDFLLEPGSKVILNWDSQDDSGVVAHRIEFDHPLGGTSTTVVADGLPGTQQAYEWTVPDIGFAVNGRAPRVRVVAVDTAGQEGWDASDHVIPSGEVLGTVDILSDLTGPFVSGVPGGQLCWDGTGVTGPFSHFEVRLIFDADRTNERLGASFSGCLPGPNMGIPFVSTDTARVALIAFGTTNRVNYAFSEPFTIRPDTRLGDAPPSITMLTPAAGQSFAGGGSVPITWTASDDEAVQAFHIQASYDSGRTWHFLAEDLSATTTSFNWNLPPLEGIADVRVRVIVVDQRFQNSSDGADRSLVFTSGPVVEGGAFCDASDGALASCPCANPGSPQTGCDIQQGTGGVKLEGLAQRTSPLNRATLQGTGFPSASTPTSIVIRASSLDPAAPVVFGDGLRCIGTPVVRLAATFASGGTATHVFGHGSMAPTGTNYYQLWFRNTPALFCTPDAFNLSNGETLTW